MSDNEVTISVESEPESPGEEIAEEIIDNQETMLLGNLVGRVEALEQRCQYHDDLINLHTHDGLISSDELMEHENRVCERIESIASPPVVEQAEPEPIPEPIPEPEPEAEETHDEPPKSRRKNKSLADRYYGR